MLAINDFEQGTENWLEWRKDKIGASDIPIILGISKYCTAYNLWRKKVGFLPEGIETPAMARGKYLEPLVRGQVNEEKGYNFVPVACSHKELDWAIASLDGYDDEKGVVLEIKCTSKLNHELAMRGSVPEDHMAQVQWQLFVTGAENALYVHYYDNINVYVDIKRDDDYIKNVLLPAASDFYKRVTFCDPPEIEEKDYVQIIDLAFKEVADKWKEHYTQRVFHEKHEKEFREKILEFTDDGNCEGFGIRITRTKPRETIDWKALYQDLYREFPEAARKYAPEKYKKESMGSWRVSNVD